DELRVDLGPRHLDDLDLDAAAGQGLELLLELLDLGPLAADDHARPRRREQHGHRVAGPLDLDLGDPGEAVLLLDEAADLEVLDQAVAELVLGRVPTAPPVFHHAHAEAGRSDLLAHESIAPRSCRGQSHRYPRPPAPRSFRLKAGPRRWSPRPADRRGP